MSYKIKLYRNISYINSVSALRHITLSKHERRTPTEAPDRQHLPDPWLFDSEALLRELARCRETALQIPVTNPNATHFGVQLTVNAIYNLEENLRYLLHLHRDGQRAVPQKSTKPNSQRALSQPHTTTRDRQPQARRGNASPRSADNRVARGTGQVKVGILFPSQRRVAVPRSPISFPMSQDNARFA